MPRRQTTSTARTSKKLVSRAASEVPLDIVPRLLEWFGKNARELPWRLTDRATGLRDPYRVLVSEVMLQQTQVSRVEPKFLEFLERFPTIRDLAGASESSVLAAWTGLGYYRRARMLQAAAKKVVADFSGTVPRTTHELRTLPGIGAYTAGAVASLAFGEAAPLVDTNVSRVLLRVAGRPMKAADPKAIEWCWREATQLVGHAEGAHGKARRGGPLNAPGAFNESLMELGATVCTMSAPACQRCPVASLCEARKQGTQDQIPLAPSIKTRTAITHAVLVVRDVSGRVLVEPRSGQLYKNALWEGLWQAPTLECDKPPRSVAALASRLGISVDQLERPAKAHDFVFRTTLRDVRFVAWEAMSRVPRALVGPPRMWKTSAQLNAMAMSSPTRRILLGGAAPKASKKAD